MQARVHTHAHKHARAHTHTHRYRHTQTLASRYSRTCSFLGFFATEPPPAAPACVCVCLCDFVLCGPCTCQHARTLRRVYVSARTHDSKDREVPQQACAVPCCDLSDGCPLCHNHARGCGSIRQTGHLSLTDMHGTQHVQSLHAALTVKQWLMAGV